MILSLRKAEKEDIDLIYEWANDPVTRASSFNTAQIPYEDHVKWFSDVLTRNDRTLLVAVDGDTPVGQMRIDDCGSFAELSYTIAPSFRQRGYGRELIACTLQYIKSHEDEYSNKDTVTARVKPGNTGSSHMLLSNGFIKRSVSDTYIEYKYDLKKRLFIRVDMNPVIATGHLMRCLSIADAAKKQGAEVVFISADDYPAETVRDRGYECIVLGTDWQDMESELGILGELIKTRRIDNLLIDSYRVTEEYLEQLTALTRTIYIDDVNAFRYPVDDLIVYADYYKKWNLAEKYDSGTRLILGTDFVPLRSEFAGMPAPKLSEGINNILVMSGGSDSLGILEKMLEALTAQAGTAGSRTITVICGRYYGNYDALCDKYKNIANIRIYKSVPNLIDYIRAADFCITAGGTTLYEICACGTCAATYSFADNQIGNVRQFEEEGLMPYLGDARFSDAEGRSIYENAVSVVDRYDDMAVRSSISERMRKKIDGRGAERIVKAIFGAGEN